MLRNQPSLKLNAIIALMGSLVGARSPSLVTVRTRPLTLKEDISITMSPAEAQVMHCEDTGECSQEISELEITRHSTTAKTEVDDAAAVAESTIEASLDGETVAEIAQSALLNRESAYPMAGTDTTQEFSIHGGEIEEHTS